MSYRDALDIACKSAATEGLKTEGLMIVQGCRWPMLWEGLHHAETCACKANPRGALHSASESAARHPQGSCCRGILQHAVHSLLGSIWLTVAAAVMAVAARAS